LLALSEPVREAAAARFPGDYELISPGVSIELFAPDVKRNRITVELRPSERPGARGVLRALRELPDWEVVLLRTTPLVARPATPTAPARAAPRDPARPRRPRRRPDGARRTCAGERPRDDGDLRPGGRRLAAA